MTKVEAIAQRVEGLATSDRLRLAAELLDSGAVELAKSLALQAVNDMACGTVTVKATPVAKDSGGKGARL